MHYMGVMKTPRSADVMNFVVQVEDRSATAEIASELEAMGLNVERVLARVGVVGGSGPKSLEGEMLHLKGVKGVRAEGAFRLPPMDGRIPQ